MMLPPTLIIAIGEGKLLPRPMPSFGFAKVTNEDRVPNSVQRFLKRLYYFGTVFADEVKPAQDWRVIVMGLSAHDFGYEWTAYVCLPTGQRIMHDRTPKRIRAWLDDCYAMMKEM